MIQYLCEATHNWKILLFDEISESYAFIELSNTKKPGNARPLFMRFWRLLRFVNNHLRRLVGQHNNGHRRIVARTRASLQNTQVTAWAFFATRSDL